MLKKLLCLAMALCLLATAAVAENGTGEFTLRFDEGFSLYLPAGWVSYPVHDAGIRYALGPGDGKHFVYILGQETALKDFDALRAAIEARDDCDSTSPLDLNGREFAAFIVPGLNASGCATLLNGEVITFLFTPQDDTDFMLTTAGIMAGFRG